MMRIGVKYDVYYRRTDAVGGVSRKSGRFLRMKKMLVALALALVPLTTLPALAYAQPSQVQAASVAADRPQICFVFGPWKYCI